MIMGGGGTDGPRQAGDFIGAMKGFEKDPARIRSAAYHELPCAFWPSAPSAAFEPKVFSPSDIPVMMIAAHGDGAVPYRQSETLFSRLKSGVFIEVDGGKHISYGYGNNCIDQPVTDFILSGTLPAGGRIRCENGFFDAKLLPVISASAP